MTRHLHAVAPSDKRSEDRAAAEIVAERFAAIDRFVELYGADWWDHHTEPPDELSHDATVQLELGSEAA